MRGCDPAQDRDQSLVIVAEPCTGLDWWLHRGKEPSCCGWWRSGASAGSTGPCTLRDWRGQKKKKKHGGTLMHRWGLEEVLPSKPVLERVSLLIPQPV